MPTGVTALTSCDGNSTSSIDKDGMHMGPFNVPWLTFLAFVVTAASIVLAVAWAAWDSRRNTG